MQRHLAETTPINPRGAAGTARVYGESCAAARAEVRRRAGSCVLRSDGVLAQFVRFVIVGGSSNALYALLFLILHSYGVFVANAAGVVVSTIVANELHRRLTFHASARVSWFVAQWEAGGLALVGVTLTSVALASFEFMAPTANPPVEASLVVAISAFVGVLRFLALRGWVFSVSPASSGIGAGKDSTAELAVGSILK
ncbi:GtrA family protein [Rhodococcus sp. NPDC059968]|uniref:GtrA family protein n=1 Tax=Rhodococcus sp. NPDC059968 TaxID=3347017 RepID=UPI0036726859